MIFAWAPRCAPAEWPKPVSSAGEQPMPVSKAKEMSAQAHEEADLRAARRVLRFAGEALSALSENLDGAFTRALDVLIAVRGRVAVSAMGKSGHVGRKTPQTFAPTENPAQS